MLDGREQQEGRRRPWWRRLLEGKRDQGRKKEKDLWSREVSPYNRLGSLTYEASFACHLLHHLDSRCSFCASFLRNVLLLLPFGSLGCWSACSFALSLARSFVMHRCIRSLHNYYSYREQQLARCRRESPCLSATTR